MQTTSDQLRVRLRGAQCVYCGEPAGTREHFPPQVTGNEGYILPCCAECNSLAGTAYPFNFWRRANFVKSQIRKKYAKALRVPDWDEHELSQVGVRMRREITAWLKEKKIASDRIAWNVESYLSNIDPDNAFVPIHVDRLATIRLVLQSLSPSARKGLTEFDLLGSVFE